jgi:F-type H+-transporting ATPase subunit b
MRSKSETFAVLTRVFSLLSVVTLLACVTVVAAVQEHKAAESSQATAESTAGAEPAHGAKADAHDATHDSGSHAQHDETDLGHGNSTAALKSPTDVRFDMAIYTFVLFLILLGVLYKFAWGPIATALEQREETILRQIEEARLASEKAALSLREYEARLAAATEEARQIVGQARKDAELAKDKIVAEAREASQRERERAVADINVAKNQALDAIAQKSVQVAVSLASHIIRREVKPQEHEALIGEAINEFSNVN